MTMSDGGFRVVLIDFACLFCFSLFLCYSGLYVGSGFGVGRNCLWLMGLFSFLCARGCSRGSDLFHSVCVFCIIALFFFFFAGYQLCFHLLFEDLCSGSITQLISSCGYPYRAIYLDLYKCRYLSTWKYTFEQSPCLPDF